jgi:hypothetical protein
MGKKQHYVPQFLLRNWSEDKSSIKTYLLKENRVVPSASISSQAQKHYLYGEDQDIEKTLCLLEDHTIPVISKLLLENINLSIGERELIDCFIAMQNVRTPNAIQQTNDMFSAFAKDLLVKEKSFEKFNEEIQRLQITLNAPIEQQMELFLTSFLIYKDLKLCLLKANGKKSFIIGQDPVITLNPYLVERNWPGPKRGIGMKGVMIILPISPLYTLCLYDQDIYKISNDTKIIMLNNDDINLLNEYQFLTTDNVIYFKDSHINFELFANQTKEFREQPKANVQDFVNIKDPQEMLIAMQLKEYKLPQKFDFYTIKETAYRLDLNSHSVIRENTFNAEKIYRNDPKLKFLFNDK